MRIISEKAALAFKEGRRYKSSNTVVNISNGLITMSLFGNIIAKRQINNRSPLHLNDCGYTTVTTKDRLNTVLNMYNAPVFIKQDKGVWFMVDTESREKYEWKYSVDNIIEF